MIYFTRQEKNVLVFLFVVVVLGGSMRLLFNQKPHLRTAFQVVDRTKSYFRVNINKASREELTRIPYIGDYTAGQIVLYRQEHGNFRTIEEIKNVKGIRDANYEKFSAYLTVGTHE